MKRVPWKTSSFLENKKVFTNPIIEPFKKCLRILVFFHVKYNDLRSEVDARFQIKRFFKLKIDIKIMIFSFWNLFE